MGFRVTIKKKGEVIGEKSADLKFKGFGRFFRNKAQRNLIKGCF